MDCNLNKLCCYVSQAWKCLYMELYFDTRATSVQWGNMFNALFCVSSRFLWLVVLWRWEVFAFRLFVRPCFGFSQYSIYTRFCFIVFFIWVAISNRLLNMFVLYVDDWWRNVWSVSHFFLSQFFFYLDTVKIQLWLDSMVGL